METTINYSNKKWSAGQGVHSLPVVVRDAQATQVRLGQWVPTLVTHRTPRTPSQPSICTVYTKSYTYS